MSDPIRVDTPHGVLHGIRLRGVGAHRVSYRPDPRAWTPWEYAGADGRFPGRWDDPRGTWRTLYLGASPLACYLEVLARFRVDPRMEIDMAEILDNDADGHLYPTALAGTLPRSWCGPRRLASGG